MERPLTIAGLQAKRKELANLHSRLSDEAQQLLKDIENIDSCIRLFDPEIQLKRLCIARYDTVRAPKGQMRRFILTQLREATESLTSRDIIEAWSRVYGPVETPAKHRYLVKRISATIQSIKSTGVLECAGTESGCKLWRLVVR